MIFPVGFGVWEVCHGLEMAVGFKWTDFDPYGCVFDDFNDFCDSAFDSDGLTLFSEGSRGQDHPKLP